jgi:hypothetical protein
MPSSFSERLAIFHAGAHYILGSFGADSDLRRWGLKLAERGGKNAKKRAVVAVARSLDKYIIFDNLQWWRRGESEQIVVLKTRNLLIFRDAQNAKNSKNAANWNVSGTQPQAARTSRWSTCPISASYRTGVLLPDSADQALAESGS